MFLVWRGNFRVEFLDHSVGLEAGEMIVIPRGKYIGRHVGDPPTDEAEHFLRCPACGGWIDCRDLGQVFEHEGPSPHPPEDQPQ